MSWNGVLDLIKDVVDIILADTNELQTDLADGGRLDLILDDTNSETNYTEHHHHRKNRSYGKSADQSGNDWALEDSLTAFQAISGNTAYGADVNDEAKIFGTEDTPLIAGQTLFDIGGILVVGVSNDDPYILRIVWGTGTMGDAITAGQYSTIMVKFDSANPTVSAGIPFMTSSPKITVGDKVWIQCKNGTDNATIDFFITEAHGY